MHLVLIAKLFLWRVSGKMNPKGVWPPYCQIRHGIDIGWPADTRHDTRFTFGNIDLVAGKIYTRSCHKSNRGVDS
jgi:hypothetical protein